MKTSTKHTTIVTVGQSKNVPRVFLEGKWLARVGFEPGVAFEAHVDGTDMVLAVSSRGKRKVSGRRDNTIPVIDLQNQQIADLFSATDSLRVVAGQKEIRLTRTYITLLMRSRMMVPTEGSLFTGGGFLSLAAKLAGFNPLFGVEINSDYAEIYARNHPDAICHNMSVEQVPLDVLHAMRPLGLLTLGIPCEPYSKIRRLNRGGQVKRDKSLPPEAHELGDMFYWGLRAVEATNPHTVVIEEVPDFLKAAAGFVTQQVLRRMGYNVEARVVDPTEYGSLTGRKRAVIVATTNPQVRWPEPETNKLQLGHILDGEPHEWFDAKTKPWLFNHWLKQTAKGNGFEPPRLREDATRVPTIKKRYFAGQGDNPVVAHPTKPGTVRWFTLDEVKRLHGVPAGYNLKGSQTTAGEVLGQGVEVRTFRKIIEANKI